MVISKLKGGLGNQLFQMAAGLVHANKLDTKFAIAIESLHRATHGVMGTKYRDTIFSTLNYAEIPPSFKRFKHDGLNYQALPQCKDIVLDGYFQNICYFDHFRSFVIEKLNKVDFLRPYCEGICKHFNLVFGRYAVLHIRGGDYNRLRHLYPAVNYSFLTDAFDLFNEHKIVVLTDDPCYSRKVLNPYINDIEFLFPSLNDELLDFSVLLNCDKICISNSTFSWWGAYLNNNINKLVILPKPWYKHFTSEDLNLIPNGWIALG